MNRIKCVSLFFRIIFQIIFVTLPIFLIISWVFAPHELNLLMGFIKLNAIPLVYRGEHIYAASTLPHKSILHILTANEKFVGCLVSAIPMLVMMFILFCLIRLFKLYEKGEIFSLQHVKIIRNIGFALLISQLIIEPVYQFLMGIVLTMNNPAHHHYAAIHLDQTNIGIVLTAFLVILISWIMAEGYQLREEQQLTI